MGTTNKRMKGESKDHEEKPTMTMEKEQSRSGRMDTSQLGNEERIPTASNKDWATKKRIKKEADVRTEVTGRPPETPRQDNVSKSREADRPHATHQKCRCNPPKIRRRDKSAKHYKG